MSIFDTFKRGLQKTATALSRSVSGIFTEVKKWDDETFKKLENELISADFGVSATKKIMADIRDRYQRGILNGSDDILNVAKEDMIAMLTPGARKLRTAPDGSLTVILMVGVNGSGKTTTAGKLAYLLTNQGRKVTLAACDTFRAAAADQLEIWANRAKVRIVKHEDGSDPSAVIFDAVSSAKARGTDVVLVDTAGRLHVKDNLMKELQKMDRVVTREYPEAQFVKLLVLDATTGQNAMNQAKIFDEAVELDGIVLTKLDGTAKGGFVFSLCGELKIPVVFAGVGEKIDDLELFDAEQFVEGFL